MSAANVQLARRGYEAVTHGDVAAVAALLDENVKWHWGDPSAEGACRNRSEALSFMQRPGRRGPGELIDVLDAGEEVVVITQPPPVDGEPVPPRAQITKLKNGKVVEMVGYPTVHDALVAAGLRAPGDEQRAEQDA
jgi:ketosteroid isomerase-like protein